MPTPLDPTIPDPRCRYGYPLDQITEMVDDPDTFHTWFEGRTGVICDGRTYDHQTFEYRPSGCGPHGPVVFTYDMQRYLHRNKARA